MTTIQNISSEFDAMVPAIAADFTAWVTKQLERILAQYDRKQISQLGNSWGYDGGVWRQLRTFTRMVDENGNDTTRFTNLYRIDHDRITSKATQYAQYQVDSFKAKLEAKLVDLTDVSDLRINGLNFTFNGKLGERKVHVEQTTVLKCSNKGTLFNQWPCRIYLDGKFISEAAFKKLAK